MTFFEILLGKPLERWTAKDYWILRAAAVGLGLAAWFALALVITAVAPRGFRWNIGFLFITFVWFIVLSATVAVSTRRLRPPSG